jgi:putative transposase
MRQRAYKFRFYPTGEQQRKLRQYFGTARWVWNSSLAWRSDLYKTFGESVTGVDFSRELTFLKSLEPFSWVKDVPSSIATQALRDQDKAFKGFFKSGHGYPKFRSRRRGQSIRLQLDQRIITRHYRAGELLKIPGLGPVKIRWTRMPTGTPKMVTVSQDGAGRYWVCFMVEERVDTLPITGKTVGVDLGTTHMVILSDGTKFDNPRHLAKYREQMTRLQQRLARQQKTSNRRRKTQQRMARLHARIADSRREHLHRVTRRIINESQVICVEDLNVKGMTASAKGDSENPGKRVKQKAGLNRSLLDVAFGELVRQLEYKAAWYGRTVVKVDRFFPSSKTCSGCGHKLDELQLDVREWECPKCGKVHDRDINAALNIEAEGLKQLIHPEDAGGVRVSGGEGACPVAVSTRSHQPSSAGLEPA